MCDARWILLFILPIISVNGRASTLFEDDEVLHVELTGPLVSLIENQEERRELPFVLTANGDRHAVRVRTRGKSRTRVCRFPPLRINFPDGDDRLTVFSGQDKLKLTTHCRNTDLAESNALEEYAAYRIFNLISDTSYKVRLLRITYTDNDERSDKKSRKRYGFLIEPTRELIRRTGGRKARIAQVSRGSLDPDQAASVYIFQYLIGNTDWSLVTATGETVCCHNGDLIEIGSKLHYVPYDFDLAGLVNARYAKPDPSVGIERVTQRRYRGLCISDDVLKKALQKFKVRKDAILNVIHELPGLSDKDIRDKSKYLNRFFEQADDEDKLLRSFRRRCL